MLLVEKSSKSSNFQALVARFLKEGTWASHGMFSVANNTLKNKISPWNRHFIICLVWDILFWRVHTYLTIMIFGLGGWSSEFDTSPIVSIIIIIKWDSDIHYHPT